MKTIEKTFTAAETISKLIGKVMPVEESNEDGRRYENLEQLGLLAHQIIEQIYDVSKQQSTAGTVVRAKEKADQILLSIKDYFE